MNSKSFATEAATRIFSLCSSMASIPPCAPTSKIAQRSSMNTAPAKSDVVVVGAGIAGLVVARGLSKKRFSVSVLEARDRVGGRLLGHTPRTSDAHSNGASVDLGATWFWPGETHVEALVKELQVPVHAHYTSGDALFHAGTTSQRLSGNPIDAESSRFTNGAASLTDGLAAQLPSGTIHLSSPVTRISITEDAALVEHAGGVIQAQHVVVAIPPALASHAITFDPKLPEPLARVAARCSVWMGSIAKVVAVYRTPFWRREGLSGSAVSQTGPVREFHDISGPDGTPAALFGFAPVTGGAGASGTPEESQVKRQLIDVFGDKAGSPQEIIVQDWSSEEFTSPPGVARLGSSNEFGHSVFQKAWAGGRLHWASTETSRVAPGHIEGAIVAAQRVVREIAAA